MKPFVVCSNTEAHWQPTELVKALLSRHCRQVVSYWICHEQFLDAENEPCVLTLNSADDQSFEHLVHETNPHLSPVVVRNELLRKGVVEQDDNGFIILRRSAYVTAQTVVESGSYTARMGAAKGGIHRGRWNDEAAIALQRSVG